jgi:tRNA pseudouridine synthase 10
MIYPVAKKILKKQYVCDHCLGRQFAQLLTGESNRDRGRRIRSALALEYEAKPFQIEKSNFHGYRFRQQPIDPKKPGKCSICGDFFLNLNRWSEKVKKSRKGVTFKTFLVGTKISKPLALKEEKLWNKIGMAWSEPMKSEINRELGKILEKKLRKTADEKRPNVTITLDLENNKVNFRINSIFVFGLYQKRVRGIPQTKWSKYKESVEDIIAKPILNALKAKEHALHGMGREDIDAKCLGWRPFVLELKDPKKRKLDLKAMKTAVNKGKKVKVKDLKPSNKKEVIQLKEARPEKSYRVLAEFEKPIKGLTKLKTLKTVINQKTPRRVLHRRADILRKRRVTDLKWEKLSAKRLELHIRGEAGLYIKELVTGDEGRTKPSVAKKLDNPGKVLELDVTGVWFEGL